MTKEKQPMQEFTHHVKKARKSKNKKSIKKLLIVCLFITITSVIIIGLVIGINIAKNS